MTVSQTHSLFLTPTGQGSCRMSFNKDVSVVMSLQEEDHRSQAPVSSHTKGIWTYHTVDVERDHLADSGVCQVSPL